MRIDDVLAKLAERCGSCWQEQSVLDILCCGNQAFIPVLPEDAHISAYCLDGSGQCLFRISFHESDQVWMISMEEIFSFIRPNDPEVPPLSEIGPYGP